MLIMFQLLGFVLVVLNAVDLGFAIHTGPEASVYFVTPTIKMLTLVRTNALNVIVSPIHVYEETEM